MIKIDFVSDVVCPWCAIGLASLREALRRVGDEAGPVALHFQPFELNAQMAPEGEDVGEHLSRKYGISAEQIAQGREAIAARGAALGFTFGPRSRIWNTFDAHRLLHWAGLEGAAPQLALKSALLEAYHGRGENVSDAAVLVHVAQSVGLDGERARAILAGDEFADAVRASEQHYQQAGISSVPAVILNDRYLVSGGQPPEVFEQALRQVMAEAGRAA